MILLETITEDKIRQMVTQFYQKVRNDDLLGPVFGDQIADPDWPHHLDRMCDFWSSILLTTGRFHGNPRLKHAALPHIEPEHFERWLALFEPTLHEIYDADTANQIFARALRMREVLQTAACA
ncbi:MAG: group III truncated hemoglobin [Candidatus Latescibacteria bacterium]|jgi:hemoglobin|nr:group III truncated hemoglobin [Candidatus Latescibacterota bacterium]MBT5829986.1 group III truncated hemoglobin [Candidatus Latescibacterota bacterium]